MNHISKSSGDRIFSANVERKNIDALEDCTKPPNKNPYTGVFL